MSTQGELGLSLLTFRTRKRQFLDEMQSVVPWAKLIERIAPHYPAARSATGRTLNLALENIDHTRTKARSPQTNSIVERLHKTMLNEFYRVAFRKTIYTSIEALQADLDAWLDHYNNQREHQGRWCYGKTPLQTFLDSIPLAKEKLITQQTH
jgi:transposase InsO family protein